MLGSALLYWSGFGSLLGLWLAGLALGSAASKVLLERAGEGSAIFKVWFILPLLAPVVGMMLWLRLEFLFLIRLLRLA